MKKVFSILLIVLILISSIHLTVATHICGGKFSTAKIGLEGVKASCGMVENSNDKDAKSQSGILYSHCCENISRILEVDNFQVLPSIEIHEISINLLHVFIVPIFQILFESPLKSLSFADVGFYRPLLSLSERLTYICVFRK